MKTLFIILFSLFILLIVVALINWHFNATNEEKQKLNEILKEEEKQYKANMKLPYSHISFPLSLFNH
jgi:Flp pilus assembly protein TadB